MGEVGEGHEGGGGGAGNRWAGGFVSMGDRVQGVNDVIFVGCAVLVRCCCFGARLEPFRLGQVPGGDG